MKLLLIVVGMPGAGKSTVVSYLSKRGWPIIHFGQITLNEVARRNIPLSPESEKEVRESLRKIHGSDAYAKLSLNHIKQHLKHNPTIIDGLYSWDEYKFIKSRIHNPLYVIAVCANSQIRYDRLAKREIRPLTSEEAEKRDCAEIENIQKGGPIAIADYTILNNDSKEALEASVENVVSHIIATLQKEELEK